MELALGAADADGGARVGARLGRARAADAVFVGGAAVWFLTTFTQGVAVPGVGVSWNVLGTLALWGATAIAWALRLAPGVRPAFGVPRSAFAGLVGVAALWWFVSALRGRDPVEAGIATRSVVLNLLNAAIFCGYFLLHLGRRTLARVVVAATAFCAVVGILEYVLHVDLLVAGVDATVAPYFRVNALSPNPIVLAFDALFAVPLALYLVAAERRPAAAFAAAFAAAAALGALALAVLLTFNRQSLVVMVAILAAVPLVLRGRRIAYLAGAGVVAALLAAPFLLPKFLPRFAALREPATDASFRMRRDQFLLARETARHHPVAGIGLGQFPVQWREHVPEGTFYAQYERAERRTYIDLGYMQVLAESGAIGLAAFVLLWGAAGAQCAWLMLRGRARADGESRADANWHAALLLLVVQLALLSLAQDTLLRPRVWLTWMLVAYALVNRPAVFDGETEPAPASAPAPASTPAV